MNRPLFIRCRIQAARLALIAGLLAVGYPALPLASRAAPAATGLIVSLRDGTVLAAQSQRIGESSLRQRWGGVLRITRLSSPNTYRVAVPPAEDLHALQQTLAADPAVAYVEPDYLYHAQLIPNDPLYGALYAFPRIGAEAAWDETTGNSGLLIAVVDTGVYAGHPDLAANIVPGRDFVNDDDDASDDEGHGTHTAGIIAAIGNNGRGIAGMCWRCRLLPVKVLDGQGSGTASTVAAGIRYAADRGARVINLSLGGKNPSRLLHEAVIYATGRGAVVVAAAGNEALEGNPVEYPAAYEEVIAVAATDRNDNHAPFSNHHRYVDIAASGVNIGSTAWEPGRAEVYAVASGTSAATPFVAGLAGLIWSVNPALPSSQVRHILLGTAVDLGQPGTDPYFGAGRIDARQAIEAALLQPRPEPRAFLPIIRR